MVHKSYLATGGLTNLLHKMIYFAYASYLKIRGTKDHFSCLKDAAAWEKQHDLAQFENIKFFHAYFMLNFFLNLPCITSRGVGKQ